MSTKIDKIVEKFSTITPLEGRILVLPNKLKTYKAKQFVGRPKDPKVDPKDIDADTEMMMVEELVDVNYRYQTATVIQIPIDEDRFKVGDTILYTVGTTFDFDYVKGVSLIRKYDVIAVV